MHIKCLVRSNVDSYLHIYTTADEEEFYLEVIHTYIYMQNIKRLNTNDFQAILLIQIYRLAMSIYTFNKIYPQVNIPLRGTNLIYYEIVCIN